MARRRLHRRASAPLKRARAMLGSGSKPEAGLCWQATCIECGFLWISAVRPIQPNTYIRRRRNKYWSTVGRPHWVWDNQKIPAYRCVDRKACNARRRGEYTRGQAGIPFGAT